MTFKLKQSTLSTNFSIVYASRNFCKLTSISLNKTISCKRNLELVTISPRVLLKDKISFPYLIG